MKIKLTDQMVPVVRSRIPAGILHFPRPCRFFTERAMVSERLYDNSYKRWPYAIAESSPPKFQPASRPGQSSPAVARTWCSSTCAQVSRPGIADAGDHAPHRPWARLCVGWALRQIICEGLVESLVKLAGGAAPLPALSGGGEPWSEIETLDAAIAKLQRPLVPIEHVNYGALGSADYFKCSDSPFVRYIRRITVPAPGQHPLAKNRAVGKATCACGPLEGGGRSEYADTCKVR